MEAGYAYCVTINTWFKHCEDQGAAWLACMRHSDVCNNCTLGSCREKEARRSRAVKAVSQLFALLCFFVLRRGQWFP